MKRISTWLTIATLTLLIVAGVKGEVRAAPVPQLPAAAQSGIAMTPAIQDRLLGPAEKSVSFGVELANQTDRPITFTLSTNDFTSLNQTGGLAFLGSDVGRVTNGHGLSSTIKLDNKILTIPANTSRKLTAKIDDVSKLAPGGHYTAILAQALPGDVSQKGNRVAINQVVSSLIFLETAGQGTKTIKLLEPPVDSLSFSLPQAANLVFKATGNTQAIPRGVVTIERGDHEIGRGIINENSSLLLPGSTRLFQTPISGNKRPWWPGRYTLRVQYRYESSLGVTTYQKTFVYLNLQVLLLAAVLLVVVAYGVWRSRTGWLTIFKGRQRRKNSSNR